MVSIIKLVFFLLQWKTIFAFISLYDLKGEGFQLFFSHTFNDEITFFGKRSDESDYTSIKTDVEKSLFGKFSQ